MNALSAAQLLQIWELARDRHPIDRALALLCAACPGWEARQLARLPVGHRDALLLALRQQTIGPQLRGYGKCPQCATQVEFSATITDLLKECGHQAALPEYTAVDSPPEYTLSIEDHVLHFRLPDSFDLAAILQFSDPRDARSELLQRCVLAAVRDQADVPVSDLSDEVVTHLSKRMGELDALAEVRFALSCPQCRHAWTDTTASRDSTAANRGPVGKSGSDRRSPTGCTAVPGDHTQT